MFEELGAILTELIKVNKNLREVLRELEQIRDVLKDERKRIQKAA